jgi:hypothetical protein
LLITFKVLPVFELTGPRRDSDEEDEEALLVFVGGAGAAACCPTKSSNPSLDARKLRS